MFISLAACLPCWPPAMQPYIYKFDPEVQHSGFEGFTVLFANGERVHWQLHREESRNESRGHSAAVTTRLQELEPGGCMAVPMPRHAIPRNKYRHIPRAPHRLRLQRDWHR